MSRSVSTRLQRLMHSVDQGEAIMAFLRQPTQIEAAKAASEQGLPAVVGVSEALLTRFGPGIKNKTTKSMIGMAIRWLMEQQGYALLDSGVKVDDPVFASGSRYRRVDAPSISRAEPSERGLVERLLANLSDAELDHLIHAAQAELQRRSTSLSA